MDSYEARVVMESIDVPIRGVSVETGFRGASAYLKIGSRVRASEFAVVSTPGDGWFSLDVGGGYSYDYFEEEISDADATRVINRLAHAAFAYTQGQVTTRWSRILRIPTIVIGDDDGPLELSLSVPATIKHVLRVRPSNRR